MRRYLSTIDIEKPGRSARRTAESVGNRIMKVDELMVSADPVTRLHLIQERIELHAEMVRLNQGDQLDRVQLERQFVRVARSYGDRHGLTYAAWRQAGVDADVLEAAGIRRGRLARPAAAQDRTSAVAQTSVPSGQNGVTPPVTGGAAPAAASPAEDPPVDTPTDAAGPEAAAPPQEDDHWDVVEAVDTTDGTAGAVEPTSYGALPVGAFGDGAAPHRRVAPADGGGPPDDPWEAAMLEAVGIRRGRAQANAVLPHPQAHDKASPLQSGEQPPS